MRKTLLLMGVAVALCAGAATKSASNQSQAPAPSAASAATPATTTANIAMPTLTPEEQRALAQRFSPGRLAALRARLQTNAQRAVRDDAEQGFREPTAEEAAALARPTSDATGSAVALAGGGAALKADAASLEFVKVTLGQDGTVVTHDGKGARRGQ
jgi:hypothetical protein